MTQIAHQNEFVRFLKILQVELQEHQKAYDGFLMRIQKPIAEILHNDNYIDAKLEQEQEQEQELAFTRRPH